MATISAHSFNNTPRRCYIALNNFNENFFSYDGKDLDYVSGANCENCPKGRILRENGRKLYPPGDSLIPGPYPGITTYMVGVFDAVSFLNGFINPNSPIFTPMNTDKPTYVPTGDDSGGESDDESNRGPPVFTRGDILADGDACIGGILHVNGEAEFEDNVNIKGRQTVEDDACFESNIDISGNLNVNGTTNIGLGGSVMVSMNYIDLSCNNVVITFGNVGTLSCPVTNLLSTDLVLINGIGGCPAFINHDGGSGLFLNGYSVTNGYVNFNVTNTSNANNGNFNVQNAKALCIRFQGSAIPSVPLGLA